MATHTKKSNSAVPVWLTMLGLGCLLVAGTVLAALLRGRDVALLNPKGIIAEEQYKLLVISTTIMLVFAGIVLFFIYFFVWRFRETNNKSTHDPAAGRSKLLIFAAWASPITVFVILSTLMLPATQKLTPQRPIQAANEQMTIRVIAMRWKWLFLYPEQNIATVNYVQIPVDTPIRFELTADEAPMNGFWIPHLGGMLYSMTEHVNPLHLMAHTIGDYEGGASEVNGRGFSGMRFMTRVSSREDFDAWVDGVTRFSPLLDGDEYERLLVPSEYDAAVSYYSPDNQQLFSNLLAKYAGSHDHYETTEATEHGGHN